MSALVAWMAAAVVVAAAAASMLRSGAATDPSPPSCLGEFQLCPGPSGGSCVLQVGDCNTCSSGQYLCPTSATCVEGAEGYMSCPGLKGTHLDWTLPTEDRIDYFLSVLTLEEKTQQLQNDAPAIYAQGIPSYNWLNDDVHAVMQPAATVFPDGCSLGASWNREILNAVGYLIGYEARATHNAKVHSGDRGHKENGAGITAYSPNMNLVRDPRWGRAQEVYSEDPFLTGRLTVAYVQGQQGANETETKYMMAGSCCKHFVAYDVEDLPMDRMKFDAVVGTRDMWESYLPAFEACVVEAQAVSVMCSYNSLNGVPTCADDNLLNGLLRERWNFTGFVVSDYDAWANLVNTHHVCEDMQCAAALGINAGMDQEGGGSAAIDALPSAVAAGSVSTDTVDMALRRLMRVRIGLGMLDPPTLVQPFNDFSNTTIESAPHLAWAYEAAIQGMTLYKNDGATLPLNLSAFLSASAPATPPLQKIALIGPQFADPDLLMGNYADEPRSPGIISLLGGMASMLNFAGLGSGGGCVLDGEAMDYRSASPGPSFRTWTVDQCATLCAANNPAGACVAFTYVAADLNCFMSTDTSNAHTTPGVQSGQCSSLATQPLVHSFGCADVVCSSSSGFDAALEVASTASVVVVSLGLEGLLEGETRDRPDLVLPGLQYNLLSSLRRNTAAPPGQKIVCVLVHGGTFALQNLLTDCDAILDSWYPGQEGGHALADTLFGARSPAGRTPVTWYAATSDLPELGDMNFYANSSATPPSQGVTYRFFQGTPDIAFGFGLSYTSFEYTGLVITSGPTAGPCDWITVQVTVSNVGHVVADEVVQVYVKQPHASVPAPQVRLVGFERVMALQPAGSGSGPGQARTVSFAIDPAFHSVVLDDGQNGFWKPTRLVEAGTIEIYVGGSQPGFGQATLRATVDITSTASLDECAAAAAAASA